MGKGYKTKAPVLQVSGLGFAVEQHAGVPVSCDKALSALTSLSQSSGFRV